MQHQKGKRSNCDDANGGVLNYSNFYNNYSVTEKGSAFQTNNSDGASCGPNTNDPFSPTYCFHDACSDGFATPKLKLQITNLPHKSSM